MVAQMPVGQFGNTGKNILIGPALSSIELSICKNFKPKEAATLQIRKVTPGEGP